MGQYIPPNQPIGRVYTATEVQARLETAKREGELMKDSRGMYHIGASGFNGISHYLGSSGILPSISRVKYEDTEIKPQRFTVRGFIREAVNDLKAYFKPSKKENQHAE